MNQGLHDALLKKLRYLIDNALYIKYIFHDESNMHNTKLQPLFRNFNLQSKKLTECYGNQFAICYKRIKIKTGI